MEIEVGNAVSKIITDDDKLIEMADDILSVKQPGYYFSPSFKKGYWDGRIRFLSKRDNSFPTGLLDNLLDVVGDVKIKDSRDLFDIELPEEIKLIDNNSPTGFLTLRDYQYNSVKNALKDGNGVVNLATNAGKTEVAAGIIQQLLPELGKDERIIFVTHSKEIFEQSAIRLSERLGIEVGKVGSGEWNVKPVTLVMIPTISRHIKRPTKKNVTQNKEMRALKLLLDFVGDLVGKKENNRKTLIRAVSVLESSKGKDEKYAAEKLGEIIVEENDNLELYKRIKELEKVYDKEINKSLKKTRKKYQEVIDFLESARCFIGDEIHHASSDTWYKTLMLCKNATYRIGLTGTVDKKDEVNTMRLYASTGNIISRVSNEELISRGFSAKPTIYLKEINEPVLSGLSWQEAYKLGIVENEYRNNLIAEGVLKKYNEGMGCLVIVNHVQHGDNIKKMLDEYGVENEFIHGGSPGDHREQSLLDMRNGDLKVLIATNILDEGVDISGINALWLAAAGKSYRQTLQRVGRGLRVKKDGSGLEVYDYLDYHIDYLTKHTLERFNYYNAEGFEIKKI